MDGWRCSCHLLVVAIVEAAVGDSEQGARLRVVGVFAIALQKGEGGDEIALLQEVVGVWQPQLLLLYTGRARGLARTRERGTLTALLACTFGASALLRLMAETGLAIILTDLNLNL